MRTIRSVLLAAGEKGKALEATLGQFGIQNEPSLVHFVHWVGSLIGEDRQHATSAGQDTAVADENRFRDFYGSMTQSE